MDVRKRLARLIGCKCEGLVYFLLGETLCLQELDALLYGCILCLCGVSTAGDEEKVNLRLGRTRKRLRCSRDDVCPSRTVSHSALPVLFLYSSVMFRLVAQRASATLRAPPHCRTTQWLRHPTYTRPEPFRRRYAEAATKFSRSKTHMNIGTIGIHPFLHHGAS